MSVILPREFPDGEGDDDELEQQGRTYGIELILPKLFFFDLLGAGPLLSAHRGGLGRNDVGAGSSAAPSRHEIREVARLGGNPADRTSVKCIRPRRSSFQQGRRTLPITYS